MIKVSDTDRGLEITTTSWPDQAPCELKKGLARCFGFYNTRRWHTALDRRTQAAFYFGAAAMPETGRGSTYGAAQK